MSTWMRDIFNRTHPSMGQPTPTPASQSGSEENFGAIMDNIPQPMPPAPNPQGAMNGLMSNFNPPAPQGAKKYETALYPQPPRQSWLDGLMGGMTSGNDNAWLLPSTPQQGGGLDQQMPMGGMFGITKATPQSGPMSYGGMGFGGGAPQQPISGGVSQMPVGGGVSQMPAFQAPQPMPLMPQQPMPGMQPYNFSQQMGQTAPPSPMNGQMKGMFGVR